MDVKLEDSRRHARREAETTARAAAPERAQARCPRRSSPFAAAGAKKKPLPLDPATRSPPQHNRHSLNHPKQARRTRASASGRMTASRSSPTTRATARRRRTSRSRPRCARAFIVCRSTYTQPAEERAVEEALATRLQHAAGVPRLLLDCAHPSSRPLPNQPCTPSQNPLPRHADPLTTTTTTTTTARSASSATPPRTRSR